MDTLAHVKETIDWERFAKIKAKYGHLTAAEKPQVKYLDLDRFLSKHIGHLKPLGVFESRPLRILDLGSGCGFLAQICEAFGHTVYNVDMPWMDLFDDMMWVFHKDRIDLRIEPYVPMNLPWKDIDLVTGIAVKFDAIGNRDRYGPEEWKFFLADMAANNLAPHARVFFSLNQKPDLPAKSKANTKAFESWGAMTRHEKALREVEFTDIDSFRAAVTPFSV